MPQQRAADDHRREPDATHRIAERMRRLGRLADRAQHQAGARAIEEPRDRDRERDREIDHRMLAKERRPDERQVGQAGDGEVVLLAELFLRVADADEGREAGAEEAQRETGRVLVGVEPDHEHAEGRGEHAAGDGTGAEGEPVVAGVEGGREAGDGGDQHHPFGAEVDDAGALVDEQAERREREHGARVERRGDEERELVHQVPFARRQAGRGDDRAERRVVELRRATAARPTPADVQRMR